MKSASTRSLTIHELLFIQSRNLGRIVCPRSPSALQPPDYRLVEITVGVRPRRWDVKPFESKQPKTRLGGPRPRSFGVGRRTRVHACSSRRSSLIPSSPACSPTLTNPHF